MGGWGAATADDVAEMIALTNALKADKAKSRGGNSTGGKPRRRNTGHRGHVAAHGILAGDGWGHRTLGGRLYTVVRG